MSALPGLNFLLYEAGKLGAYYPSEEGSTAYETTDHLGNVRALLRDEISVYTATMEDNGQPEYTNPRVQEMQFFQNLFETEKDDRNMNHTCPTATLVSDPSMSSYLFWQTVWRIWMQQIKRSVRPRR